MEYQNQGHLHLGLQEHSRDTSRSEEVQEGDCDSKLKLQHHDSNQDEWSQSLKVWTKDMQALMQSEELCRVATSTTKIMTLATRQVPHVAVKMITMPLLMPIHIMGSIWDVATRPIHYSIDTLHTYIHPLLNSTLEEQNDASFRRTEETPSQEEEEENGNDNNRSMTRNSNKMPHEHVLHFAASLATHIKDDVAPSVLDVFGIRSLFHQVDMSIGRVESDVSYETCCDEMDDENDDSYNHPCDDIKDEQKTNRLKDSYFVRVLDLNRPYEMMRLDSSESSIDEFISSTTSAALSLSTDHIHFMPHENVKLANRSNVCVDWKPIGSTEHWIRNECEWSNSTVLKQMEREVLLWSGRMKDNQSYGTNIPLFKARGIVSHMNPLQLMEIFYDSAQCQTYNRYSNGRRDVCILKHDHLGRSKIVENETKIPFCGKAIQMQMLMTVMPLSEGGFIIVSRSVYPNMKSAQDKNNLDLNGLPKPSKLGERDEILWSINILRGLEDPNKTDLTLITQANSCMIPSFFAEKVGIMCSLDFFKRLRQVQ